MEKDKINLGLIIENCKRGHRSSQRKLYEQFYGYGMKIALRFSKNKEEAMEILNDAFLKIFKNLNKYDTEQPFKPWLRKVIVNASIDYYRSHQAYWKSKSFFPMIEPQSKEQVFPELYPQDVLPAIQQLTPAYRMVFNLFVMEGYKHQEIAEMLDISVSTSRSNLLRAKEKLKSLLLKDQALQKRRNKNG